MLVKKIIYTFVFLLFICANSVFATDYKVLKNGQTVIVKQVKNNPVVVIDTWVKTGSINETEKNNGVSHFLEHLLFKGTKNHPAGEIDKFLETKGGIVNAATSKDFTHYYIEIPSKDFDTALDLHSDMLLNPTIPVKELEKERKVVIEEISKDLNSPDDKVYDNLIEMIYKQHPYKRKVIGTEKVISTISRDEIFDYYNKFYVPQNFVTIVVGDVEPDYVYKKVEEKFNVTSKKSQKFVNKKEKPLTKQSIKVDYQPVSSGYFMVGFRGADISQNDTYALDVLATILGDGRSSILYQNVKEKEQLAFRIDAGNGTFKEDGMFVIQADFKPENAEKLKNAIFQETNNIIKNGVSEKQLNLAKKLIRTETEYSRESVLNIASQIGYTTILADTPQYYEHYLNNIDNVTIADVKRVAKYLCENKSAISIVLPLEYKNKKPETVSEKNYNASFVKESNGIKKYELENKSTVLINKNDQNDIIAISIQAKGGTFLEKIPATASLMASTMLKGTSKYSKNELALIMEENGIKINPYPAFDTFIINVITTKSQLPKTLELLNEVVNNATFEDFEIEKAKNEKLNSIKKSEDIPMSKALNSYRELLYGKSPYTNGNSIYTQNYPKIKKSDIEDYYHRIFSAQNLVISINGNVGIDDVLNPLSKMFKQNGATFNYSKYKIPNSTGVKIEKMKDLKTAWLFTGWQVTGVQNRKDWATLLVMDSILGSGMSSRLFVDLREKEGLAYQIGSEYSPKMLKGAFTLYIGTNPENVSRAKKLMMDEIVKLKTTFVSDKELKEAKEKLIGRYVLALETNLDKASAACWYEISGRGFDFNKNFDNVINSVTPYDIVSVANKYFKEPITSIIEAE